MNSNSATVQNQSVEIKGSVVQKMEQTQDNGNVECEQPRKLTADRVEMKKLELVCQINDGQAHTL